jgi:hypothetical protein
LGRFHQVLRKSLTLCGSPSFALLFVLSLLLGPTFLLMPSTFIGQSRCNGFQVLREPCGSRP